MHVCWRRVVGPLRDPHSPAHPHVCRMPGGSTWEWRGAEALAGRRRPGRPAESGPEQLRTLEQELLKGPQAHGYETQLWTLGRIGKLLYKCCRRTVTPA